LGCRWISTPPGQGRLMAPAAGLARRKLEAHRSPRHRWRPPGRVGQMAGGAERARRTLEGRRGQAVGGDRGAGPEAVGASCVA